MKWRCFIFAFPSSFISWNISIAICTINEFFLTLRCISSKKGIINVLFTPLICQLKIAYWFSSYHLKMNQEHLKNILINTWIKINCMFIFHDVQTDSFLLSVFIGVQLIYNVVLVFAVQQSESVIHMHISPLFQISFPFRSPKNIEESSLCYAIGSHQLSILYIKQIYVTYVYICQSQFPNSFHSPSPLGIHKFVFYIWNSVSALHIRSSIPSFLDPIVILYNICFSLSNLLHYV